MITLIKTIAQGTYKSTLVSFKIVNFDFMKEDFFFF